MFSLTYKYKETAYTIFSTTSSPRPPPPPPLLFQSFLLLIIITISKLPYYFNPSYYSGLESSRPSLRPYTNSYNFPLTLSLFSLVHVFNEWLRTIYKLFIRQSCYGNTLSDQAFRISFYERLELIPFNAALCITNTITVRY